jgi:hypothetical protein
MVMMRRQSRRTPARQCIFSPALTPAAGMEGHLARRNEHAAVGFENGNACLAISRAGHGQRQKWGMKSGSSREG